MILRKTMRDNKMKLAQELPTMAIRMLLPRASTATAGAPVASAGEARCAVL